MRSDIIPSSGRQAGNVPVPGVPSAPVQRRYPLPESTDRRSPATPVHPTRRRRSYGLMVIRLSTFVTPGADQAARSAS